MLVAVCLHPYIILSCVKVQFPSPGNLQTASAFAWLSPCGVHRDLHVSQVQTRVLAKFAGYVSSNALRLEFLAFMRPLSDSLTPIDEASITSKVMWMYTSCLSHSQVLLRIQIPARQSPLDHSFEVSPVLFRSAEGLISLRGTHGVLWANRSPVQTSSCSTTCTRISREWHPAISRWPLCGESSSPATS